MNAKNEKAAEQKPVKMHVNNSESGDHNENDKSEGTEQHELIEEKLLEKMSEAELLQKIEESRAKADKNYDLYVRAQAEIENIIKRNKKEKEEWIKYSNETLIKDLLPVIDNLEKAVSHSDDENALQSLKEGVELTLKGLRDTLAKSGLEEVVSMGMPFDPNFHHAVSEQEDENSDPGTVINEFQKGYSLNRRLIRPAMVIVSKGRPKGKK
ncbi:MAG: nucleotide exchange factor GrpE [Deltaproteobacteria bacterium]|nr:nucleotide exchange factor GrpE [Deltaproteobacteria bacterium]